MTKDKELLSVINHILKHKELLLKKLEIARYNTDVELYEILCEMIDTQHNELDKCLELLKSNKKKKVE